MYNWISLICLLVGGILGIVAVWNALQMMWLNTAIFGTVSVFLWVFSTLFAQYAIASSGRQK